jgi:hypothetical protein
VFADATSDTLTVHRSADGSMARTYPTGIGARTSVDWSLDVDSLRALASTAPPQSSIRTTGDLACMLMRCNPDHFLPKVSLHSCPMLTPF